MQEKRERYALGMALVLMAAILVPFLVIAASTRTSTAPRAASLPTPTVRVPSPTPSIRIPTATLPPIFPTATFPPAFPTATLPPGSYTPTPAAANILRNGHFEYDANGDNRPDDWTSSVLFSRSSTNKHAGTYAGKLYATDNPDKTIRQSRSGILPGKRYTFSGWVNIPSTSDAFTFSIKIEWLNSSDAVLRTETVRTFAGATSGWNYSAMNGVLTPAGTAKARVSMVVTSLNGTIYVDDFYLRAD